MIADALKTHLSARPFAPFELTLGSGQSFTVRQPEFASLSPGGRHLILWVGDDRYVDIDLLLIESIDRANGQGKRRAG